MSAQGAAQCVIATELANAVKADQDGPGCDIAAGIFGPAVSAWIRKMAADYLAVAMAPPDNGGPYRDILRIMRAAADACAANEMDVRMEFTIPEVIDNYLPNHGYPFLLKRTERGSAVFTVRGDLEKIRKRLQPLADDATRATFGEYPNRSQKR
jgi:hypothetical protein